jgi:high-affinity iron transporter
VSPWRPLRDIALALTSASVLASTYEAPPAKTPVARGAVLFSEHCALCHGAGGAGDGRAASVQNVPPANLTVSWRSRRYKIQIVSEGGGAVGRSSSMPAWRDVLTDAQIADVVEYVQTLNPENRR